MNIQGLHIEETHVSNNSISNNYLLIYLNKFYVYPQYTHETSSHDESTGEYELFCVEPSGANYKYYGTAVGKGKQGAKTEIEKLKLMDLPISEAKKEVTKILRKLFDEAKDKQYRVEMSVICAESENVHTHISTEEIASYEEWALEQIEAEEDMEED